MFFPGESPLGPQEWLLGAVKKLQMCGSLSKAQVGKGGNPPATTAKREHGHLLFHSALRARIIAAD